MRRVRYLVGVVLTGLVAFAVYLTLLSFDLAGGSGVAEVRNVPNGHQEIALLLPATEGDTWERLVAAIDALEQEWPKLGRQPNRLQVNKENAFIDQAAGVPEVSVGLGDKRNPRLWIRWYKLSSETDCGKWLEKLSKRPTPPLAVLGGENSGSAMRLAEEMKNKVNAWQGQPPLLLLTTATADLYQPDSQSDVLDLGNEDQPSQLPRLIEKYPQRSFRYSFTNRRMAAAVLDFVDTRPDLWPNKPRDFAVLAGCVGTGQGWGSLSTPLALNYLRSYLLHTLEWSDNSYSVDLSARFQQEFQKRLRGDPRDSIPYLIAYSAGDFYQPNPPEKREVGFFVQSNLLNHESRKPRQLVALPTSAERAQRWLNDAVRQLSRSRKRNLVAISGDSISFNSIYRDRNSLWNPYVLDVSLVIFCHRNPIDQSVGFRVQQADDEPSEANTSTDDLLLHRDIIESLMLAAYENGRLLTNTDTILARMRQLTWNEKQHVDLTPAGTLLFRTSGERRRATGEHVVWLRPETNTGPPLITTWYQKNNHWEKGPQELKLWPQTWGPLSKH